jgi:hypothetical protein
VRAESVERIDLLKVDVEKTGLDVLDGIEEGDWPRIRQLVGRSAQSVRRGRPSPRTPGRRDALDRVAQAREIMRRFGAADKPIWVTEVGWA